jgi:hypothetical protein
MSATIRIHSSDTPEPLQQNSGFLPDNILHSVHRPVFFTSAGLIIAFSLYGGGFSEQGDLIMTTDFRSVYGSMIGEWMGVQDVGSVLGGDFAQLSLIS